MSFLLPNQRCLNTDSKWHACDLLVMNQVQSVMACELAKLEPECVTRDVILSCSCFAAGEEQRFRRRSDRGEIFVSNHSRHQEPSGKQSDHEYPLYLSLSKQITLTTYVSVMSSPC